MCDVHEDRPAARRVQSETDSFGCEYWGMCKECFEEHRNAPPNVGMCDWCETPDQILRDRRDYEEGMHGRLYSVCKACIKKENDRLKEELESSDYLDRDYG